VYTSCVLRGALHFFNEIFLLIKKKKLIKRRKIIIATENNLILKIERVAGGRRVFLSQPQPKPTK